MNKAMQSIQASFFALLGFVLLLQLVVAADSEVPVERLNHSPPLHFRDFEPFHEVASRDAGCTPATTTFTSSATFSANLASGYFLDNFANLAANAVATINRSGGTPAISVTWTATGTGDLLFPIPGVMSTNTEDAVLTASIAGTGVTMLGATFWPSDVSVNNLPAESVTVTVTTNLGQLASVVVLGQQFRGWRTNTPGEYITKLEVQPVPSSNPAVDIWPTVTTFYVGAGCGVSTTGSLTTTGSTTGSCSTGNHGPFVIGGAGTNDCCYESCVCGLWPDCCGSKWGRVCVEIAHEFCNNTVCTAAPACTPLAAHDPFTYGSTGTDDCCYQDCVCAYRPQCCTGPWNNVCIGYALDFCGGYCP